jgi:adenylate cyclase
MDVWLGASKSPRESLGKAAKLCKKAIALDENQDAPHAVLGHIYALTRKYDKAIEEGERSIVLNPNSAGAYVWFGMSLTYAGRSEEAIEMIKKGMRLSPFPPAYYMQNLGNAYREAGRYEEAITEYKKCVKRQPNNIMGHSLLSMTYALAGRYEEAREAWSEVLKINPKYSVEIRFRVWPDKNPDSRKRAIGAMHKAGLK